MPTHMNTAESFWAQVDMTHSAPEACWEFRGCIREDGYGTIRYQGKAWPAHRLAWVLTNGPLDDAFFACHSCDNRRCCRPSHLWPGTAQDNVDDMVAKGRHSRGDHHYARTHPERLARGDKNGSRLHPERRPRGDNHPSRIHPERIPKGQSNPNAKLTDDSVRFIRHAYDNHTHSIAALASMFGVSESAVGFAAKRKTWTHVK